MASAKAILNERLQRDGLSFPSALHVEYSATPVGWQCSLRTTYPPQHEIVTGTGATKKLAEQKACATFLELLDTAPGLVDATPASGSEHTDTAPASATATGVARAVVTGGPMTLTSFHGRKVERMCVKGYDLEELYDWLHGLGGRQRASLSQQDPRTGYGGCNYKLCYNIPPAPLL